MKRGFLIPRECLQHLVTMLCVVTEPVRYVPTRSMGTRRPGSQCLEFYRVYRMLTDSLIPNFLKFLRACALKRFQPPQLCCYGEEGTARKREHSLPRKIRGALRDLKRLFEEALTCCFGIFSQRLLSAYGGDAPLAHNKR